MLENTLPDLSNSGGITTTMKRLVDAGARIGSKASFTAALHFYFQHEDNARCEFA